MTDLLACIHYVKSARGKLPSAGMDGKGWDARHKALAELGQAIARDLPKVKINERGDGTRVSIAGVRASSTSGLDGALANWVAAAYRQLDKTSGASSGERENVR
jgi:hypothetical protein